MTKLFNTVLFFIASLTLASTQAATVKAIKGSKAMIEIQDEILVPGEQYYLVDDAGKRTGLLIIKQVKGNRAIADIAKGKGTVGQSIQSRAASGASSPAPKNDYAEDFVLRSKGKQDSSEKYLKTLKGSWGLQAALSNNTMTANVAMRDLSNNVVRSSANMSGTSFGLHGFFDKPLTSSLVLHINGAYEMFSVTGSSGSVNGTPVTACGGTTNCNADISYLSGYGLLKWYASNANKYRFWLGGGFGYMMNVSSSSNALTGIGATVIYKAALGTDIQFSRTNYMPIALEYAMFPSSPTVEASMILLKLGYAWNF